MESKQIRFYGVGKSNELIGDTLSLECFPGEGKDKLQWIGSHPLIEYSLGVVMVDNVLRFYRYKDNNTINQTKIGTIPWEVDGNVFAITVDGAIRIKPNSILFWGKDSNKEQLHINYNRIELDGDCDYDDNWGKIKEKFVKGFTLQQLINTGAHQIHLTELRNIRIIELGKERTQDEINSNTPF